MGEVQNNCVSSLIEGDRRSYIYIIYNIYNMYIYIYYYYIYIKSSSQLKYFATLNGSYLDLEWF